MFMRNRKHIHFTPSLPVSFLEKCLKLASQPYPNPRFLSFLFFFVVFIPPLCLAGLHPWSLSTTFSHQSPPSIWLGVLYKSLWQNPNIGLIRLFIFCRSAPRLYKQLCGLILSLVVLFCFQSHMGVQCCLTIFPFTQLFSYIIPHNRYSNFCSII